MKISLALESSDNRQPQASIRNVGTRHTLNRVCSTTPPDLAPILNVCVGLLRPDSIPTPSTVEVDDSGGAHNT